MLRSSPFHHTVTAHALQHHFAENSDNKSTTLKANDNESDIFSIFVENPNENENKLAYAKFVFLKRL
jgi:hypothetical protein